MMNANKPPNAKAAPSFTAGRGLKPCCCARGAGATGRCASFTAGRGLKHVVVSIVRQRRAAAPSFTAGRGLKHVLAIHLVAPQL